MRFATNWTSEECYMILVFISWKKSSGISKYKLSCECLVHRYLDLLVFHIYVNRISVNIMYEKYPRLKITDTKRCTDFMVSEMTENHTYRTPWSFSVKKTSISCPLCKMSFKRNTSYLENIYVKHHKAVHQFESKTNKEWTNPEVPKYSAGFTQTAKSELKPYI